MNPSDLCCCGFVSGHDPNPDCERCRLVWYAYQTSKMRKAQIEFEKTGKRDALAEAKRLQDIVDRTWLRLREVPSQQELF